jgi:hypothetical protein
MPARNVNPNPFVLPTPVRPGHSDRYGKESRKDIDKDRRSRGMLPASDPATWADVAKAGQKFRSTDLRLAADQHMLLTLESARKLLRPNQWAFARAYVLADGARTLAELSEEVGVSVHTVQSWLSPKRFPEVLRAIEALRAQQAARSAVTRDRHIRDMQAIRDQALEAGAYSAAVQAEYRRGQVGGLYVERKEIRTGSIDSMSREEVERRLREIEALYAAGAAQGTIDAQTGEIVGEESGPDGDDA